MNLNYVIIWMSKNFLGSLAKWFSVRLQTMCPRCSQFNKNPGKQTKFSIFIANKTDRFTLKRLGNMINWSNETDFLKETMLR